MCNVLQLSTLYLLDIFAVSLGFECQKHASTHAQLTNNKAVKCELAS